MIEGITDAIRSWILQVHFIQRQGTHQLWQRHGERDRDVGRSIGKYLVTERLGSVFLKIFNYENGLGV
jgi:hypothetical protein